MANELKHFSDEDLLEEICRRQRVRLERDERIAFKPCDECAHYKHWTQDCDPPDSFNPCSKGHKMSFRVPEQWDGSDGGYYRRVCADRSSPPVGDGA